MENSRFKKKRSYWNAKCRKVESTEDVALPHPPLKKKKKRKEKKISTIKLNASKIKNCVQL